LEKVVSDYRDEGRRSVYAKQRKRAERELEKAKSLDGVPMRHTAQPLSVPAPPPAQPEPPVEPRSEPLAIEPKLVPRRVFRFPSGATFEHPSRGPNVRVQIHKNLLGHWVDENGERVEPIETEPAPHMNMTLTDDGQWIDLPPKPKPWSPPVGVKKPKEPSEMTAAELYGELQSLRFEPADLLAMQRPNKLMVPAKGENERIPHAPYCPAAGGLGGCCCDAGRGKSRNYNERF
jgi:hypothetical protein